MYFVMGLTALAVVLLVAGIVALARRDRRQRHLPLLLEVADYSMGVLACPGCRGTSFQSPPAGERGFFGFAVFFLVFGQLSSRGTDYAECVACRRVFRRGQSQRAARSAEQRSLTSP